MYPNENEAFRICIYSKYVGNFESIYNRFLLPPHWKACARWCTRITVRRKAQHPRGRRAHLLLIHRKQNNARIQARYNCRLQNSKISYHSADGNGMLLYSANVLWWCGWQHASIYLRIYVYISLLCCGNVHARKTKEKSKVMCVCVCLYIYIYIHTHTIARGKHGN